MITVITATLPERGRLLAEAATSLARQTLAPVEWLVHFDHEHAGPIKVLNELAERVQTPWLFPFGDDDLLEADHFDTLKPYLTDDVDVVYSWCTLEGEKLVAKPDYFQDDFDPERLRRVNTIPASACIRTALWKELGGYRQPDWTFSEDWDFWIRALDHGARFRCVPIVTWRYRLGDWPHLSQANWKREQQHGLGT